MAGLSSGACGPPPCTPLMITTLQGRMVQERYGYQVSGADCGKFRTTATTGLPHTMVRNFVGSFCNETMFSALLR